MILTVLFFALLAVPPAGAVEPERLNFPSFAVTPSNAAGEEADHFRGGNIPHFNIRFALALSATRTYSIRMTLIQDANGKIEETVLYEGTLAEGTYNLLVPGVPPPGRGEIKAKIVMRVRMFKKKFTGDDFYAYRQWEGTYRYGK